MMKRFSTVLSFCILALGLSSCGQEDTGGRLETRASISGQIILKDVDGLNDTSRVRVEIGQGEGGTIPDETGKFSFSDIEPDAYTLIVTYSGGMTAEADKSAYQRYETQIIAQKGGSVNLGQVELKLGLGIISGGVKFTDGEDPEGALVKLNGTEFVRETTVLQGEFVFHDVPVGLYTVEVERLGYAVSNAKTVCGAEVTLNYHEETISAASFSLASTAVSLLPGEGQTIHQDGNEWYLTTNGITVNVQAGFVKRAKAWLDGQDIPDYSKFSDSGYTFEGLPEGVSKAHFQFKDLCGYESDISSLTFIHDSVPPVVGDLRLNGGKETTRERSVSLAIDADDALSDTLEMKLAVCSGDGEDLLCDPSLEEAPWQPFASVSTVTFDETLGMKTVKLKFKDITGNETDVASTSILFDDQPPQDMSVQIGDGSGTIHNASVLITITGDGPDWMKVGETSGLAGIMWQVYSNKFTHTFSPEDGDKHLFVIFKDAAGNQTEEIHVQAELTTKGSISGHLTIEGRNDSAGVTVSIDNTDFEMVTAQNGVFTINNIPAGTYNLTARLDGYDAFSKSFSVVAAQNTVISDFKMELSRGAITGTANLAGTNNHSEILIQIQGEPYSTVTNDDGAFTISGVPVGSYTIKASKTNYTTTTATDINVVANSTVDAGLLELSTNPATLTGTVYLEGRDDHAGIIISLDGAGLVGTTDVNGAYTINGIPSGTYSVTATFSGYETKTSAVFNLSPGEEKTFDEFMLTLSRGNIWGTATLEDEDNHGSILIEVRGTANSAVTNSLGEFFVQGVPVGSYTLVASKYGFTSPSVTDVNVVANRTVELEDLLLQTNPATVSGFYLLEGANDHSGITVTLDRTGLEAQTATDGSFSIEGVIAGDYTVTGDHTGFEPKTSTIFSVTPGEAKTLTPLRLALSRGAITGLVQMEGVEDHGGALIEVQDSPHSAVSTSTGEFIVQGVPEGLHTVVISKPSFVSAVIEGVDVPANQEFDVGTQTLLANSGSVSGMAILEGEIAHAGTIVTLDGSGLQTTTEADGAFALNGLMAGTYSLTFSHAGYRIHTTAMFTLGPGDALEMDSITLRISRGAITGNVELTGETDHSNALVEVVGTSHSAVTNAEGDFYVSDIPIGSYTVRISKYGFLSMTLEDVEVVADMAQVVEDFVLPRNPGTVFGSVLKQGESDHAGILVGLNGTGYTGTTLADGSFTITDIAPGVYSISAQAEGYIRYDYPLVLLEAGESRDLGEVEIEPRKGTIKGEVILEGMSYHSGVQIELLGTEYSTTTGTTGAWELFVPIGNYEGVRASRDKFETVEDSNTITVTETGTANVQPMFLSQIVNDIHGTVHLSSQAIHSGITVEVFGVIDEETEDAYYSLVTDTIDGSFIFTNIPLGPYYVKFSYEQGWESITRYIDLQVGEALTMNLEVLKERFIKINEEDEATTTAEVTLTLGASDCYRQMISEDPSFDSESWEVCTPTKPWSLSDPDGEKTVYAKFKDSQGVESDVVLDSIILDREATILSVTEDTGGQAMQRNDVVHFTLDANHEINGTATVNIAGYASGIELFDNGTNGDTQADNGVYELDYRLELSTDINDALVTGSFTDQWGNPADSENAPGTITVSIPPLIRNVRVVPNSVTNTATISWETDEATQGLLEWGLDSYYGETENSDSYTSEKSFTVGDGALVASTPYHYRITATDTLGNQSVTVDRIFYLQPNPPNWVVAMPGDGRFDIRWEAPPQENVEGYNIYRTDQTGGPYIKQNTDGLYTHEALMYTDPDGENGITFYYVVTAVDEFSNESEYSEEVFGTSEGNNGGTEVCGGLPDEDVWTTTGSPYHVTCNIANREGAILVIGPGVDVTFDGGTKLIVRGQIVALGEDGAALTIGSSNTDPLPGDWVGIEIEDSTPVGDFDYATGDYRKGNLFYRTILSHAVTGVNMASPIHASPLFKRSTLSRNTTGLWGRFSAYDTEISHNTTGVNGDLFFSLHSCTVFGNGTGVGGQFSSICDSFIQNNTGTGVATDFAWIEQSVVSGNGTGISSYGAYIKYSTVSNNTGNGLALSYAILNNVAVSSNDGADISEQWMVAYSTFSGNGEYGLSGFGDIYSSIFTGYDGSIALGDGSMIDSSIQRNNDAFSYYVSGSGSIEYNNFSGAIAQGGFVNAENSVIIHGNNFSIPAGSSETTINASFDYGDEADACGNCWGDAVTTELDGGATDVSVIWDYQDDVTLGNILFCDWAAGEFPDVQITSPGFDTYYLPGDEISFTGQVTDREDGVIPSGNLEWSSDLDGVLGMGTSLTVSNLNEGKHEIWLSATDSNGQVGKALVKIQVGGLMWQNPAGASGNWYEAMDYCDNLIWGGYDDWRLPTKDELASLLLDDPDPGTGCYIDRSYFGPCSRFWSSSSNAYNTYYAWYVDFYSGSVNDSNKTNGSSARCVRAGP